MTMPIPGSELYKEAVVLNPSLDECWDKLLYVSNEIIDLPLFVNKEVSEKDLSYWRSRAYKDFYLRWGYFWKRLTSIRNLSDLKMNIEGFKILLGMVK
jgi:hypothetical protein